MGNIYEENIETMFGLVASICQDRKSNTGELKLADELLKFIEKDLMDFLKTDTPVSEK